MNTTTFRPVLSCLLLSCVAMPLLRAADFAEHIKLRPTQFSCDIAMTTERGQVAMHLDQDGDKKHTEMTRGTQKVVMIVRPDQQKMYMLMVERRMAMEMPYDSKKAQDDVESLSKDAGAKIEAAGSETLNGVVCDKFLTTSSAGKKGTVWIAQEQHTVQRWVGDSDKATAEFTNYRLVAPEAVLFEVPEGYQKMTMPAGMPPGGAGGGARPASQPPTPPTPPAPR